MNTIPADALKSSPRFASAAPLRRFTQGAVLGFVVLSASIGCAANPTDASVDLPEKNIDQWTLPLDEYRPSIWQDLEWTYADLLLTGPCMRDKGFQWDVPYRDLSLRSSTTNASGIRIFNEQVAETWGYQMAPLDLENRAEWEAFDAYVGSFTEAQVVELRECQDEATAQLPSTDEQTNFINSLAMEASDKASGDAGVRDAVAKWRACMASLGVSDLPPDPAEMPTQSQLADWGIPVGVDAPPTTAPPSADQIEAALFDFNCRSSSGWYETRYAAEWDAQVELVREFKEELDRHRADATAIAEKVTQTIAENASAAE